MSTLDLRFPTHGETLWVRSFSAHEALSRLFELELVSRSLDPELDLRSFLGEPAELHIGAEPPLAGTARRFRGICAFAEQEQAEPSGLSTYRIKIVPKLWLLTQRRNHRVFQHTSVPEIAAKLFEEWGIEARWEIDTGSHPALDYRVQYGETDLAFLGRLLEEEGITFRVPGDPEDSADVVLSDRPHAASPRTGGPIVYLDHPTESAGRAFVTAVRVAENVRPGRVVLRDVDMRNIGVPLSGEAQSASTAEHRFEVLSYRPGAFAVDHGDQGGRADMRFGQAQATRALWAERASRRHVDFRTNVADVTPGAVVQIHGHPREDLGSGHDLLVTDVWWRGGVDGTTWEIAARAARTEEPYVPARSTPKPRVDGLQSALVVGPPGEEIHTDELGRVRVLFHWDRERKKGDQSSCWIRVSQGWGGSGYGLITLPRVGQEVLVGFLEGDPDQPVIVGRLFNGSAPVPYRLPAERTRSGWRSATSPGGEGYNEICFEDAKGREVVSIHAERDLEKRVERVETERTGVERIIEVGERLTLTTGRASIVLDGADITIHAEGMLWLRGEEHFFLNEPADDEEEDEDAEDDLDPDLHVYSPGVEVRGSPELARTVFGVLDKIAAGRAGSALLAKIARGRFTVEIQESKGAVASCQAREPKAAARTADGGRNEGCGSLVLFNPAFHPGGKGEDAVLAGLLNKALSNMRGARTAAAGGRSPDAAQTARGGHSADNGANGETRR